MTIKFQGLTEFSTMEDFDKMCLVKEAHSRYSPDLAQPSAILLHVTVPIRYLGKIYLVVLDLTGEEEHLIKETDWDATLKANNPIHSETSTPAALTQEERNKLVKEHINVISMLL